VKPIYCFVKNQSNRKLAVMGKTSKHKHSKKKKDFVPTFGRGERLKVLAAAFIPAFGIGLRLQHTLIL